MDIQIINWINNNLHGWQWLNYLFKYITYLGEKGIIWILLIVILLCIPKTRKIGVILGISLACETLICNIILKPVIARPRPYSENVSLLDFFSSIKFVAPTDYSFPSGHAGSSFAVAVTLTMLTGKKGIYTIIIAFLISISRLFLCVHYLSDVIAGILIGSVIAILVVLTAKRIKKINL